MPHRSVPLLLCGCTSLAACADTSIYFQLPPGAGAVTIAPAAGPDGAEGHVVAYDALVRSEAARAPQVLAAAPKTENPRLGEDFQQGMAVLLFKEDYQREELAREIDELYDQLAELGVNAVSVSWPLYQESHVASEIRRGDRTPADEDLALIFRKAQERGWWVTFRPYLEESNFFVESQIWRGTLEPEDRDAWFRSYGELLVDCARIAEETNVDLFSIGVEFNSLDADPRWRDLIAEVRGVYSGLLTYAANFDNVENVTFWDQLDMIGIDAFYPLDVDPDNVTLEAVMQAWQPWVDEIEEIKQRYGKGVVLMEVGTTSQRGSLRQPWIWASGEPVDLETQRVFYEATCRMVKPVVAGMYWWVAFLNPPEDPSQDTGHTPIGKPAEREIEECYTNGDPTDAAATPVAGTHG